MSPFKVISVDLWDTLISDRAYIEKMEEERTKIFTEVIWNFNGKKLDWDSILETEKKNFKKAEMQGNTCFSNNRIKKVLFENVGEVPEQVFYELITKLDKMYDECQIDVVSYKNKLKKFMIENEIWHIKELDYYWRTEYEKYLDERIKRKSTRQVYMRAFDRVKLHAIKSQIQISVHGKTVRPEYKNIVFYLPYHPDIGIAERFDKEPNKDIRVWDFTQKAPEKMKRQVFQSLHYFIENAANRESVHAQLGGLSRFYAFCIEEQIEDIEKLEVEQLERFKQTLKTDYQKHYYGAVPLWCGKALFMEADEIHWDANVWYMERMHLQPERVDPSGEVCSLSFAEVKHKGNRKLLQTYLKYCIGITNLSISNIRKEFLDVRSFLVELNQAENENVCTLTTEQMNSYFQKERMRELQETTYNKRVISIFHFSII